jgi:hypothetical protein
MDSQIRITPGLNYRVKLAEGIYYPAIVDIKKDYAELMFYFPDKNNNAIELKARCLETKFLEHLSISNSENEMAKIFISKDILEPIRYHEPFEFSPSSIKNATEVKDYKKYFEILK